MNANKLVYEFASLYQAYNYDVTVRERIEELTRKYMPSGSGFEFTTFNFGESSTNNLVFDTMYNHSNKLFGEQGTSVHSVIVKPDFINEFSVEVTGYDLNEINEYIGDIFFQILDSKIKE